MSTLVRTLFLLVPLLVCFEVAAAQDPSQQRPEWYEGHVTLQAGVSVFDRSGVGATGVYALRADLPLYPSLLVEGGVSYARPGRDQGVGEVFVPGAQVQLQATSGQFSPYVGLGAGVTVEKPEDGGATDSSFSPSFATGVRIALSDGAGLRVEGRLNAVGADFQGVYSEMTMGLIVAW